MKIIERSIKIMWKCQWRYHPTPPHPTPRQTIGCGCVELWDGNESAGIFMYIIYIYYMCVCACVCVRMTENEVGTPHQLRYVPNKVRGSHVHVNSGGWETVRAFFAVSGGVGCDVTFMCICTLWHYGDATLRTRSSLAFGVGWAGVITFMCTCTLWWCYVMLRYETVSSIWGRWGGAG